MITRRQVLLGGGAVLATGLGLGGYAFGVEPMLRLDVTEYRLSPPGWPPELALSIAVLADIHAVNPWMGLARIGAIARFVNTLGADLVLLAGDYEAGIHMRPISSKVAMSDCAEALSTLEAPLGIYSVLGNHDMWVNDGRDVRKAFGAAGIPVLENKAQALTKDGTGFWLLGLADQCISPHRSGGLDDLPGTLAQITDNAPALLLAHEPDIFPSVPDRVSLTICGHTHGGQVRIPGIGPLIVPSRFGTRYAYGHVEEGGRHMVVSGGLGMTGIPVRFGVPPEIVMLRLGGTAYA